MSVKDKIQNTTEMIKLSEFFIKMSEYQQTFDHPKMASDSYVTAKTLLYWAMVGLEEKT
jgi:hypothetical protein